MWLKSLSRNHTEGMITTETAVCSFAVIVFFSLFITLAGYCRTYNAVKEFADEKAKDASLLCYSSEMELPGIIPTGSFDNPGLVKNLFLIHESWGDETSVSASYTYTSFLGDFRVCLKSSFTKWNGDAPRYFESVWDLPPNERGKKIEEIFGGGLPEFFPVLDAYDSLTGHAASIVSLDTTLDKYRSGNMITEVLIEKTDDLVSFEYGKAGDTVITGMDIDSRELIVVLPLNSLLPEQEIALEFCSKNADENAIWLTVKRYQTAENPLGPELLDIEY